MRRAASTALVCQARQQRKLLELNVPWGGCARLAATAHEVKVAVGHSEGHLARPALGKLHGAHVRIHADEAM